MKCNNDGTRQMMGTSLEMRMTKKMARMDYKKMLNTSAEILANI